ncbi:MAG: glycosyltransferase [Spirochaetaceae bacterium]|nr:glycosyltransferase [Spirochaetaceae bacterium]
MIKLLFTASRASHIMQFHQPYIDYYLQHGVQVYTAAQGQVEIPNVVHKNIVFEKQNLIKNFKSILELRKFIKTESIDVVISNATLAGIMTRVAVFMLLKKPKVIHSCHGYLFSKSSSALKKFILICIEKIFSPVTSLVLTMNQEDFAYAQKYKFAKKIINIPGIGYMPKFENLKKTEQNSKQMELCRNFITGENVYTIVYAAELSVRKNQTQLVDLLYPLLCKHQNWRLILAGDGILKEELADKIKTLNIENKILLPGFISNIYELLSAADVVVSTSKSEGLPFNIMDAMTLGVPVLASDVKGHSDLIISGKNGFLFSLNEPSDFANKLETLETDKALRQTFVENAKTTMNNFLIETVQKQVLNAYSEADSRLKFWNNK